jgi:hypothetical protein
MQELGQMTRDGQHQVKSLGQPIRQHDLPNWTLPRRIECPPQLRHLTKRLVSRFVLTLRNLAFAGHVVHSCRQRENNQAHTEFHRAESGTI